MIGVLTGTALLLAATTHDIAIGPGNAYTPQGLRVATGDTVSWAANGTHPLVLDEEGPAQHTSTQDRTLNDPGAVHFHCAVHGDQGMTGVVSVGDVNSAPAVAVQRETAAPVAGAPVAFRAVASDPERLPLRIDWDLDGDGSFERAAAGPAVSAVYAAGTHTVSAQAVDDLGLTARSSHTFTVPAADPGSAPPPPPPAGTPQAQDTLAPVLTVRAPRSIGVRKLRRRGVRVTLTPSEDGRVTAVLRSRAGRRLARAATAAYAGQPATLRLRARRAKPGRATLRLAATDAAGNRTVVSRRLRVAAS